MKIRRLILLGFLATAPVVGLAQIPGGLAPQTTPSQTAEAEKPERIVTGLSQDAVSITTNFTGSEILIYGAIRRDTPPTSNVPPGIIVTVEGPSQQVTVRRKERIAGIWVNTQSLQIASAAAEVVERIGLPEGRLTLAQATIHLATAPKSNAVITAVDAAISDVRSGGIGEVPRHLRDGHYKGAKGLGNGIGYKYAHNAPSGVVPQQYAPDELHGREYYQPSPHGNERELGVRLDRIRGILRKE